MQVTSVLPGDIPIGDEAYGPGVAVTICFGDSEIAALQASYDPSSSTSPSAAVSRPIVRAILDAVRAVAPPDPPDPP